MSSTNASSSESGSVQPVEVAALPANPSLENLRNQAKTLLKRFAAGDPTSAVRFKQHPEQASAGPRPATARLADAQLVLARELGFPSWPKLKSYVESIQGHSSGRMRPFQADIRYFDGRAGGLLSQHASRLGLAAGQIRDQTPELSELSDEAILALPFTLDDARTVTAREHGFTSWARFKRHLSALEQGQTIEPFMLAFKAIEARDLEVLRRVLLADGTLVRARGTNGNSLLNLAAGCKFTPGAQLLLASGADPNVPNVRGATPLHQAAYANLPELVEILLDAGANPEISAHGDGGTPLVMALFWGHREAADLLAARSLAPNNLRAAAGTGDRELLKSLFNVQGEPTTEAGAHRDFYRPHSGFPVWQPTDSRQEIMDEALTYAARNRRIEAMAFLVERGANVNADPYRGTPLIWAVFSSGDIETMQWLLDHGAEVNLKATFGGPGHGQGIAAIHVAAQSGRLETVKFLLAHGADRNLTDDLYGGNAAGHANHWGHTELVEYLRA